VEDKIATADELLENWDESTILVPFDPPKKVSFITVVKEGTKIRMIDNTDVVK
jgi:hypothetical protein